MEGDQENGRQGERRPATRGEIDDVMPVLADSEQASPALESFGSGMSRMPRNVLAASFPTQAAGATSDACPRWEIDLRIGFPRGYEVHPRTWDAIRDAMIGRSPVMGDADRRFHVLFSAHSDEQIGALTEAEEVGAVVLSLLGLSPQHVDEVAVTRCETLDEVVQRLSTGDETIATVHELHRGRSFEGD
jgi:hypothetical protein